MGTPTEPHPKFPTVVRPKAGWALTSLIDVPCITLDPSTRFADVILRRRTRRDCSPISLEEVLSLVRLVASPRQVGRGDNTGRIRKLSISAGALHPVEILVVAGPEIEQPVLYSDFQDIFGTVNIHSPNIFRTEIENLVDIVPDSMGHYLLFTGNLRHIEQAYAQPRSLLWRDAGALLQTFSTIATANGLSFTPLGSMGTKILRALVSPHPDFVALGTAVIGKAQVQTVVASP